MKTQLIMLDTPLIVSDEEIKEGDSIWYKDFVNQIGEAGEDNLDKNHFSKIIAGIEGLPSIDWNGLEEEFGWVDVEISSLCYYDRRNPDFSIKEEYGYDREEIENTGDFARKGCACDNCFYGRSLLTEQIIKLKSLNEKKFSLEDIQKAIEIGETSIILNGRGSYLESKQIKVSFIQSLQQPKVFDIEIKIEDRKQVSSSEKGFLKENVNYNKPIITNNSIKILRKLWKNNL